MHRDLSSPFLQGPAALSSSSTRHDAAVTLLAIVLKNPWFLHDVEEDFGSLAITEPAFDKLRQALIEVISGTTKISASDVFECLRNRNLLTVADEVLTAPVIARHRLLCAEQGVDDLIELWRSSAQVLRRQSSSDRPDLPADKALRFAKRSKANTAMFADD